MMDDSMCLGTGKTRKLKVELRTPAQTSHAASSKARIGNHAV